MNGPRRGFCALPLGWASAVLFVLFAINVIAGKLSREFDLGLQRLTGVQEFLLLFVATGCLVAFTACPRRRGNPSGDGS